MWIRLMPGVLVAALLAVLSGAAGGRGGRRPEPAPSDLLPSPSVPGLREEEPRLPPEAFPFGKNSGGEPLAFFSSFSAFADDPAAASPATAEEEAPVVPPAIVPGMYAPAPRPPSAPPAASASPGAGFTPLRNARLLSGGGKSPESAYASMAPVPDDAGAAPADAVTDMDSVPSGGLPPLMAEAEYLRPPARGVRAWASGGMARARQDPSLLDSAAYGMRGTKYSAGLEYDWSVDTVLGASVGMLDATVRSAHPFDSRETRQNGLFAGASVDSVLFDSWLLGLKGFYGSLDSRGEGVVVDSVSGAARRWREPDSRSRMHGLSGNVRVPMLFWGHRAVVEAGVDYKRIATGPRSYELEGEAAGRPLRGQSSASLSVPAAVSMEKDFVNRWGMITSRVGAGYVYETSGTAGGVRALHALSASPVLSVNGFHSAPAPFLSLQKGFCRVSFGLDVRTAGGWNAGLDYRRDFAGGYNSDNLEFELGRSF